MALGLSGLDPRLLSLLSAIQGQRDSSSEGEDKGETPFGMPGGPGLDLLRTLNVAPIAADFTGQAPVTRASGEDISTPSRMSATAGSAAPISFGAVPNSSLEPSTVQQAISGIAPKAGEFPDVQVQPAPPLISAFPQQQIVQGFPGMPGVLAHAPSAPVAGATLPQAHQMLAPVSMPGMPAMPDLNLGGGATRAAGGGGGSAGGTQNFGSLGAARPAASAGASTPAGAGLINSLVKLIPGLASKVGNLFSGTDQPSLNVEWLPDIYKSAFGDLPEGSDPASMMLGDFGGPIDLNYAADPGMFGDFGGFSLGGPDISDFDIGDIGGGASDLAPFFSGDPEAGLAGSFGDAAGGAGLSLSDFSPYLGGVTGLFNLGSGIASGNPAGIVSGAKDLGLLGVSQLLPAGAAASGAMLPIGAAASILSNILMDELSDPRGRVSAVQDANYQAAQQLPQDAKVLQMAPHVLSQINDNLTDEQAWNLFNIARAGIKAGQLAADPLAHQGQRDSGAQYANFPGMASLIQQNGPIALDAAVQLQNLLVSRGYKPEDFTVPQVGNPMDPSNPFAQFYGTLYTPAGDAGEMSNPDLSPNQLAQVMNRQQDLASGGYEGRMQGIPGGTLFLSPQDLIDLGYRGA